MAIPSLEVEAVTSAENLAALAPEWDALWESDTSATPFESPAWLLPWTRHLWGGGKIRVLALRQSGRLVGLAPFFLWGYGERPETIRVSLLGAGVTDHCGVLAAPGFESACAEAIFDALWETRAEWHVCDFQELAPGSPLLSARIPDGFAWRDLPCGVCPVAPLAKTMDEQLAALDSKFRTDLRRAESRLSRAAHIEFVRAGGASLDCLLEALFRLHAARWEQRDDAGVLATARLKAFHREAARKLLEAGRLRLYALTADGAPIAVQYNLAARGRAYAYLSGFDPAWAKFSPGMVLLKYSIACAIGEGAAEFDFLRKRETFKYQWGGRERVNRRLVLTRDSARLEEVA
jgi:CelD/BcsL family acetyltransferase involved in cellulose biosynthesis